MSWSIEFSLATPEMIRAAMEGAKRLGGFCAGVVFFRWPNSDDRLVMQPDEVLIAAGVIPPQRQRPPEVHAVDGGCVAVSCVDLYLVNTAPLAERTIRYRIHSAKPLDYFLPEEKLPVKMANSSELELTLPPYCARGRMYLGRAVSAERAEFTVEEAR